ncbi:hypothetical protein [Stenotrophomonas sp.]|uniref:hypothetical protein n=1 Tax=Stenotrophomonas sp. TaxID=69392 RepID=UPI0028A698DD|nr:hypothetical protein [Stenotrophomonas sp.]
MRTTHGTKLKLYAFTFATTLIFSGHLHAQHGIEPGSAIRLEDSLIVLKEVEPEVQRFVDRQKRLPGQDSYVRVRLTPDTSTGFIWIDLSEGFLQNGQTELNEDWGEKIRQIEGQTHDYLVELVEFKAVVTRIGGRTLKEIFHAAEEQEQTEQERPPLEHL